MKSSFSSFHIKTISRRFQKTPLRGLFSKTWVFVARKRRLRVDGGLKRRTKICDFKNVRIHEDWALSWYFVFCDCPFNVIAKHTLLCLFFFCSLSCYCFLVILTSFFIKILLPRVLQIEIHSFIQLLITLYLIPSKSVAEQLSFKFGPEALDFWSTNSMVRTGATAQHNEQYQHRKVLLSSFHLNGHTWGFHPRTEKLEQPFIAK